MSDFFDDIMTPDYTPADAAANVSRVLAVAEPCVNGAEMNARAKCMQELFALRLPMVFEDETGELDNPAEFSALAERLQRRPTPAEAVAWLAEITGPIYAKHAPAIEAARALGPEDSTRAYVTRGQR
jgi:hypothetical protein